jgi:hydroxymethylglutaryl-CoA lyase
LFFDEKDGHDWEISLNRDSLQRYIEIQANRFPILDSRITLFSVTSVTMESVKLIECPRDAWQGLPRQIPTATKVGYLRRLIAAGFRHLDAVSFVSPKAVPQMADSEEVLAHLGPTDGAEIIGIVVNERGAERAIATGKVTTLGYPSSISETFLRRNQNQLPGENYAVLKRITTMADQAGLQMVAYVSMAFGNPYGDPWDEAAVVEAAKAISGLGIRSVSLADTVGAAEPALIKSVTSAVMDKCGDCEIGVHMHSTRAGAAAKVGAAFEAGCRRFDSAIGGLGGCPFAQDDLVGNIPTEEVVRALQERGIELPIRDSMLSVLEINDQIARQFSAV